MPENPPPVSKDLQKQEAVDPGIKASINKPKPRISNEPGKLKHKVKVAEKVKLKELSTHELSVVCTCCYSFVNCTLEPAIHLSFLRPPLKEN